jgi:hypothetical protein
MKEGWSLFCPGPLSEGDRIAERISIFIKLFPRVAIGISERHDKQDTFQHAWEVIWESFYQYKSNCTAQRKGWNE